MHHDAANDPPPPYDPWLDRDWSGGAPLSVPWQPPPLRAPTWREIWDLLKWEEGERFPWARLQRNPPLWRGLPVRVVECDFLFPHTHAVVMRPDEVILVIVKL